MSSADLSALLQRLITAWENEVVEFKQASSDYSTSDIGKYFSALANEANLRGAERAWLVFGVNNKARTVVGSDYRPVPERLQGLKMQIAENAEPSITFRNIHEINRPDGRVVLFEVPAAPSGMPIAWKGHYYARAGESLTNLGLDKLDEIRYLGKFGKASRQEIDRLLWGKLSEALDEEQKSHKISNLITKLRRAGRIRNTGSRKAPQWRLAE